MSDTVWNISVRYVHQEYLNRNYQSYIMEKNGEHNKYGLLCKKFYMVNIVVL